ncbi:MAG: SoxR reducing system RseC family protein [Bacteroidales bacterium]|nr:SoxR reducing system RseC family protein [Bacteroidales bacterium]
MEERVSHTGVITNIAGNELEIEIHSSASCGSCSIRSACGMSETKEKHIVVPKPDDKNFIIGQPVKVSMTARQGGRAAVYAYLIPALLMIFTILIISGFSLEDWIAAVAGIGIAAVYYFVLFLFKEKISRKFEYEVE